MMIKNSGKHAVPKKVKDMAEYAYKFVPLYADMAKRNFLDEVEFGQLRYTGRRKYSQMK